jgi:hypothetical protein
MQRPLVILACATSVAVGALCAVTATAYASPLPASAAHVVSAPALSVPSNYHPTKFAVTNLTVVAGGVTHVAPGLAVALDESNGSAQSGHSTSEDGDQSHGGLGDDHAPSATPTPTPSPSDGSGDDGGSSDNSGSGSGSSSGQGDGSGSSSGKGDGGGSSGGKGDGSGSSGGKGKGSDSSGGKGSGSSNDG